MLLSEYPKTRFHIAFIILASILTGIAISYNQRFEVYILCAAAGIGYIILCFKKPFFAFGGLILVGLTVWGSAIQVAGNISLMVIVGGAFLAIWLARLLMGDTTFVTVKEFRYLAYLMIIISLSVLLNWGGPAGFGPVFTYIQLLLLTILVVNFTTSPSRLHILGYIFILASAFLAGVILLNQWGMLPDGLVRNMQYGFTTDSGSYTSFERTAGIFGDPNVTALQLTIALPFIIEYWPGSSKLLKAWLFLVGIGILLAFLYTVSMGGLVGIATILLVKLLLVRRQNIFIKFVKVSLIVVLALWLALNLLPNYFFDRISANIEQILRFLRTNDASLFLYLGSTRGDAWLATFKTFLQSPIIGNGPGNSVFISPSNSVLGYFYISLAAHNFLLSIASDLGSVGLIFFIGLLSSTLLAIRPFGSKQLTNKKLLITRDAIFTALLICVVQGMALDLHTQKLLWILIGMALAYKRLSSPSTKTF